MLRKLIIGFFFCFFALQSIYAQEKGSVVVIKDPLLDSFISKRLELNKSLANETSSEGFRVQIYSGLEREQAYSNQSKFKSLYPMIPSYISYIQPNYRVRVGDFKSRLEAQRFLDELRTHYSSLFIFAEKINLK